MNKCSCYAALLEHICIPDLVSLVQEYVHREDPKCIFPTETRIGNISIEASIELKFIIHPPKKSYKGWRPRNITTLPLKLDDRMFNAYDLFSPSNWDLMCIQLWPNERRRAQRKIKFEPVVEELRIALRTYFEQDAHWLVVRTISLDLFSYNFLRMSDGLSAGLVYS